MYQSLPDTCQIFYRCRFSFSCRDVGTHIYRSSGTDIFIIETICDINYGIIIPRNHCTPSLSLRMVQPPHSICCLPNGNASIIWRNHMMPQHFKIFSLQQFFCQPQQQTVLKYATAQSDFSTTGRFCCQSACCGNLFCQCFMETPCQPFRIGSDK